MEKGKVMQYKYTAVLEPIKDSEEYHVYVPDLPGCISFGLGVQDAIEMITDAASIWLVVAEDEGIVLPAATPANQLEYKTGAILSEINIDTTAYRAEIANLPLSE